MQIGPLTANRRLGGDASVEAPPGSYAGRRPGAEAATADARVEAVTPLQAGLRQEDRQLSQQLSSAQQSLAFVEQLESRLLALKSEISARLAAGEVGDAGLEGKIQEFEGLWRTRQTATGGKLDGRLDFDAQQPAQRRFALRGLERHALQNGGKENLAFALGGASQRLLVVGLDPALSAAAQAHRFNLALGPAGIRAALDSAGELQFSVAEAQWPSVRDGLLVRGGGKRFPGGQLTRPQIAAEPEAIRPQNWGGGDVDLLRETLQQVVEALRGLRRSRESLDRLLAELHGRLADLDPAADREWALAFAAEFNALASQPAYRVYATVAPALASISRSRVLSLLALD